jgi:hypothetical protein
VQAIIVLLYRNSIYNNVGCNKPWPKEQVQKDKRSTKHTHKTKDRVTRTSLKSFFLPNKYVPLEQNLACRNYDGLCRY